MTSLCEASSQYLTGTRKRGDSPCLHWRTRVGSRVDLMESIGTLEAACLEKMAISGALLYSR